MTGVAPGRYCLATCYCGECPHYVPYRLTGREASQLFSYLRNRAGGRPYTPSWWAEPPGGRR